MTERFSFAEFFSGGGMARIGLGDTWKCLLANDNDPKKCSVYRKNFDSKHLYQCDIVDLPGILLRQNIDLYWASSPCQDFSLAGKGLGLNGTRSSAFGPWMNKVKAAVKAGFAPKIIAFENVVGLLSARAGADFAAVVREIYSLGYRVGAHIIDAENFLPHSRPRLFIIGVRKDCYLPAKVLASNSSHQSEQIRKAHNGLPLDLRHQWIWWDLNVAETRTVNLADIVDTCVPSEVWFSESKTQQMIGLMSDRHLSKLRRACKTEKMVVGTVYKRGRPDSSGKIVQRAELRLDGVAGCLRTPRGGSSRQTIVMINGENIQARLLTAVETARLMGLPSWYNLPKNYNEAYQVTGDGVAVPVVNFLAKKLFEPVLKSNASQKAA